MPSLAATLSPRAWTRDSLVKERSLTLSCSQTIVVGAYMIVFGLAIALLGKTLPSAAKSHLPGADTTQSSKFLPRFRDMLPSSSPSSDEAPVRILHLTSETWALTTGSLHLHRLPAPRRHGPPEHCWCHCRHHWHRLRRSRVHPLHRASQQHARGRRRRLGRRAGLSRPCGAASRVRRIGLALGLRSHDPADKPQATARATFIATMLHNGRIDASRRVLLRHERMSRD